MAKLQLGSDMALCLQRLIDSTHGSYQPLLLQSRRNNLHAKRCSKVNRAIKVCP